jgi:hypothetical protein
MRYLPGCVDPVLNSEEQLALEYGHFNRCDLSGHTTDAVASIMLLAWQVHAKMNADLADSSDLDSST